MKVPIFDLGGVVLTNDFHLPGFPIKKELISKFKIPAIDIEANWIKHWPVYRTGKMSEDEFWKALLGPVKVEKARVIWQKHMAENENMLSFIASLRCRKAALANISREWLEWKRKRFKLDDHFEVIIGSGEVGLVKPEPEIYMMMLDRLNVKASECLFIDNSQKCCDGAEAVGIKSLLFTDREKLEEDLKGFKLW